MPIARDEVAPPLEPPASTEAAGRGTTIQSVDRAMHVLRALAGMQRGGSALEIAAATGLDRTTVHRLVRTLIAAGMVESAGATYRIGPACLLLGAARLGGLQLRELALPYAVDLQRSIVQQRPAIVSISARAEDQVVIVDRIWTPAVPLNIIMGIGWRFPIDETVSGRAMLSALADEEVVALLGAQRHAALAPRLKRIRGRGGMEWGTGELHAGVSTLACPFIGAGGVPVGAMVVAGLELEADLDEHSPLAQNLRRAAQTVSGLLQAPR